MKTFNFEQELSLQETEQFRKNLLALSLPSARSQDRAILQKFCAQLAEHIGPRINTKGLYLAMLNTLWESKNKRAPAVNEAILTYFADIVDEALGFVPEFAASVKEFFQRPFTSVH